MSYSEHLGQCSPQFFSLSTTPSSWNRRAVSLSLRHIDHASAKSFLVQFPIACTGWEIVQESSGIRELELLLVLLEDELLDELDEDELLLVLLEDELLELAGGLA